MAGTPLALTSSTKSAPPQERRSLRAPNAKNKYSKHGALRQSANIKGCTLMKVPLELRQMIYELALPEEWDGKTPEIISALRQYGALYDEVMTAFHKKEYAFVLHAGNGWSFDGMDPKALATIKTVRLVVTEQLLLHPSIGWGAQAHNSSITLKELSENCAVGTDVTSVIVDCQPTTAGLRNWFICHFTVFMAGFSNLTKATTWVPLNPTPPNSTNALPDDIMVHACLDEKLGVAGFKDTKDILGVQYKIVKQVPDTLDNKGNMVPIRFGDRYKFVWEADEEKKEVLKQVTLNSMYGH